MRDLIIFVLFVALLTALTRPEEAHQWWMVITTGQPN